MTLQLPHRIPELRPFSNINIREAEMGGWSLSIHWADKKSTNFDSSTAYFSTIGELLEFLRLFLTNKGSAER